VQFLQSIVPSSLIGFLTVAYKRPQNGYIKKNRKKKSHIKSKEALATVFSAHGMWPSSPVPKAAATGQEEMGLEASLHHHNQELLPPPWGPT